MRKKLSRFKLSRWLKIVLPLGLFFILVGIVYAYFTSQDVSADLVFKTGSLKIDLVDPSQLEFSNLKPGDEQVVEYSVKNTGSMPIYLKGKFTGGFVDEGLDNTKLAPVELKYRLNDGDWQTLVTDGPVLNAEYFYSHDDTAENLVALEPDQTLNWQVKFKFAPDVDDSFQNQEYKVKLHFAARQVKEGASFPETY